VINPCGDPTTLVMNGLMQPPNALMNTLTPSTISNKITSVKASNQPLSYTWSAFTDAYSLAKGANGYTLCGVRTYSFSPTYTWLTVITSSTTPNANIFTINS